MRLIDADALIEYVNRRYDLCSDELRMMIEEQPTAYDVDKVVAELESAENYYYDDKLDAECNLIMFKSIEQKVAIDIVRKGDAE